MNPSLGLLHPYPFQRLTELYAGITPRVGYTPINLSIGEPRHSTPEFIKEVLCSQLQGLARYPTTQGSLQLRMAIHNWIVKRYPGVTVNAASQILPINGSREALFAIAQTVVSDTNAVVIMPNPFYQIYEGATLLAKAKPYFMNTVASNNFNMEFNSIPAEIFHRTQLIYVCTPGNPTGKLMQLSDWAELFQLADEYDFVIASDECYSEIYFNEASPPLGGLQAAVQLGRPDFSRLIVFSSLSKRSNVPGLRSGFVAGDEAIISKFLLYRTYHGSAMSPPVQAASIAAWEDEAHVVENRRRYRHKFSKVIAILKDALSVEMPEGAFYLWLNTGTSDLEFAKALYHDYNVQVLPGQFLARAAHGINPGVGYVRVALVAEEAECIAAATRIKSLILS